MITCFTTEIRKHFAKFFNEAKEGGIVEIQRYDKDKTYMIGEEDFELLMRAKEEKAKEQEEIDKALAPYAKAIEENLSKYPLTKEEYEEHMERFKRAVATRKTK